jgi:tRNA (guanine10-N2)-methyltransferase
MSESDLISVDGVRAGAKRLGRKTERALDSPLSPQPRACVYDHEHQVAQHVFNSSVFPILSLRDVQQYIPPTKPYELSALAADLVVLARYLLKPGGRLVFFLPTVIDEYKELDLDSVVCDGMQVIANSLQDFGAWGRRVCIVPFSHCPSFSRDHKVFGSF